MASSVWNCQGPAKGPLTCVLQALLQWRLNERTSGDVRKLISFAYKGQHPRAKRAKAREAAKAITELSRPQSLGVSLSSSVTRREEGPSECGEGSNTPSLPVQSGHAAHPSQSTAVMVSHHFIAGTT